LLLLVLVLLMLVLMLLPRWRQPAGTCSAALPSQTRHSEQVATRSDRD
jgi:hypothetical protein